MLTDRDLFAEFGAEIRRKIATAFGPSPRIAGSTFFEPCVLRRLTVTDRVMAQRRLSRPRLNAAGFDQCLPLAIGFRLLRATGYDA